MREPWGWTWYEHHHQVRSRQRHPSAGRCSSQTVRSLADRFSPKRQCQPYLFACLVLKVLLKTDYLRDWSDLRAVLGLPRVTHFATLHKAAQRLRPSRQPPGK